MLPDLEIADVSLAQEAYTDSSINPDAGRAISARFMLPDQTEHDCRVTDLTMTGATFLATKVPVVGTPIVAYVGEFGRIEATAAGTTEGGFLITYSCTGARLERIQLRVKALTEAGLGRGAKPRRHLRIEPTEKQSHIMLADGRVYPCEVLDISISSAAIKTEVMPALGTHLMLGRMKGRVVRYLDNGVAIEFVRQLDAYQMGNMAEELSR